MLNITNKKDTLVNLGTKNGKLLCFKPKESRLVDEETAALFANELEYYECGQFISIQKIKEEKKFKEIVNQESTPNLFQEKKDKKRK
jgi:hypothetical protein